ncbi:hypothetical protein [Edaphobacter dinghuensis]|uniref:Uncharacterized protein n=2 Tax=Edaphobacter dinghuensis TaxID=1560005 RepID=A0A917H5H7_9BACT|nr:hypothetical protein [Edaphobacter dinghuensis]GGG68631.1 hypothetical protein GCM10011585_08280 [Edaphobacter dinghuensis]
MLPQDLQPDQFVRYPPYAKKLALAHMTVFRQLPLSFLVALLREVIEYDFKFPAERTSIDKELATLSSLSSAQIEQWFHSFAALSLSSKLEDIDWINRPAQFIEQESAYLWATHQLDAFSRAAIEYGDRLRSSLSVEPLPMRRLGIAVVGQGVTSYDSPLFRNLRAHGTYFGQIKPDNGLELLLAEVEARAKAHPIPYGHWYVDGGQAVKQSQLLSNVSYQALEPVRDNLLKYIQAQVARPGMGPEELRSNLALLLPGDLGMERAGDPVLDRFQVRVFTEGSGTQIFSTTFAQWTTREALRRAQPLTMLVRYAPRQRQRPMNELLSRPDANPELDPVGSLVDADMAAYYHWINQQRLNGAEQASFLVWFEGHSQALVIAPSLPRGTKSDSPMDLKQLLSLAVS